jgi:NADH:ubiquinone oxidoreductase subunit F (NADH-binding)
VATNEPGDKIVRMVKSAGLRGKGGMEADEGLMI